MNTGTRHETTGDSKKAKIFAFALCAMLFALSGFARAQQAKKVARIGVLSGGGASNPTSLAAFRQGLRELGYVEGKNITIEYPKVEGSLTRPSARGRTRASQGRRDHF